MKTEKVKGTYTYNKHNSFYSFKSKKEMDKEGLIKKINSIHKKKIGLNNIKPKNLSVLQKTIDDLNLKNQTSGNKFYISPNVADEILTLEDNEVLNYLVHRYRYELFPKLKILDDYPPYLQIEPTSVCNYRCVFCFETDQSFTNKKNGFMGSMKLDLFKRIIDQAEGNVEFISLASRGEPLACPEISEMLKYTERKFLNLKINTNASLLDEKKIHAILSSGVKTVVFSADAADEKLYSKLRVNGNLNKVIKNVENFRKIQESKYSNRRIITRVSGVKFLEEQNFNEMKKLWGGLVDQVAFVEYNPWENTYDKPANELIEPCSDLWRRMFIWWDGKCNPCDVDYKSSLSTGTFPSTDMTNLWKSESYFKLRSKHKKGERQTVSPCKSCSSV